MFEDDKVHELRMNERLTRSTVSHITSGTLYFKLGQEQTFKSYINQYSSNPSALTKVQSNDERVKRTQMSHKFSLTDAAVFKWIGTLHGNRNQLVNTIRQSMIQLEKEIPATFMHPNWTLLRKPWIGAVSQSVTPRDFARALTVIKCCIKPCILLNVWKDSLGHTQFKKITAQMREDKKKSEKRERKEKEDDEERLRPWMTFVKYTLGLKHQVSKQKGEEYRAHGQNGWLWLSSSRNFSPCDSNKQGLRAGAYRLAVKYTDIRDGSFKIVLMEPKAFKYLLSKQEDIESKKDNLEENSTTENDDENQPPKDNLSTKKAEVKHSKEPSKEDEKPIIERKKLEQALKNAKLEWQVPDNDMFIDVIDVQAALSNPTRILYPKVAKTTKGLDQFLSRRLQLKQLEERRIELKTGVKPADEEENKVLQRIEKSKNEDSIVDVEGESDTKTAITSNLTDKKLNDKESITLSKPLKSSLTASQQTDCTQCIADIENLLAKLREIPNTPKDKASPNLQCYSATCRNNLTYSCYSITCPKAKSALTPYLSEAINEYERIKKRLSNNGVGIDNSQEMVNSKNEVIEQLSKLLSILSATSGDQASDTTSILSNITVSTSSKSTTETTTTVTTMVNGDIESIQTSKSKTSIETNSNAKCISDSDGTSTVATKEIKAKTSTLEELSKDGDITRIYSSKDTTGRLYLKRIQSVAESKRQGKVVRYPLAPNFYSKARKKRNILLLAKHDVKHMARKFGTSICEGFNYNSKSNHQVWPYPCPRPFFHTTWSYRTSSSEAIQSVALQLKILWACIRWDDMVSKPLNADGKHQVTTDNAITTTEILKHRNSGRFLENTQYFQRKVTIPLNVPSRPRPTSPIRSGLRKRKRAESPTQSEPQLMEKWIDENDLELWEIRAYKERLEREKYMSITRGRSDTTVKGPDRFDPSNYSSSNIRRKLDTNSFDKEELEKGYRKDPCWEPDSEPRAGRRESSIPRRFNKVYDPNSPASSVITTPMRNAIGVSSNTTPTIIRRITNPDGSISVVRTAGVRPIAPTLGTSINSAGVSTPPAKKVFISKDGKVIGTQLIQQTPNGPRIITPSAIRPGVASTPTLQNIISPGNITGIQQSSTNASSPQQKVQIVRSADGKIQVRGLLPGQQLVQMPDGRLQIFSSPSATSVSVSTSTTGSTPGPSRVVLQPPSQQTSTLTLPSTLTTNAIGPKIISSGVTPTTSTPNQVIAQQLPPGAQIPSGMTAFVSGGKTYIIPKTTPAIAQQQHAAVAVTTTPNSISASSPSVGGSMSSNSIANKTVILPSSASSVASSPQPTTPKQMVEVKALGPNVVQFKGNQMIVSGPDVQQAQLIAKQLSSGAARLATLGGKQVLISTSAIANAIPSSTSIKSGVEGTISNSTSNNSTVVSNTSPSGVLQPNATKQSTPQAIQISNDLKAVTSPTVLSLEDGVVRSTNSSTISTNQMQKDSNVSKIGSNLTAGEPTQPNSNQIPAQATAQLIQTPQGPRIILQGIQAANIPKEQLISIQQQVKNQLLKAQAEAKKDNKVPPTKIAIQLPPSLQTKISEETPHMDKTDGGDIKSLVVSTATKPLLSQPQNSVLSQASNQSINIISSVSGDGDKSQFAVSKPIMLQQHTTPTGIPGQKVIVMNQQKVGYATPITSLTSPIKPQPNTSLLLSSLQNSKSSKVLTSTSSAPSLTAPSNQVIKVIAGTNSLSNSTASTLVLKSKPLAEKGDAPQITANEELNHILKMDSDSIKSSATPDGKGDNFELTPGYIQKTISEALKTENLTPEIEQKLLALQDHNVKSHTKPLSRKERQNAIDPETGEPMDDEWDPYGTKTRYIKKKMEKEKAIMTCEEVPFNVTGNNISSNTDISAIAIENAPAYDEKLPETIIETPTNSMASPKVSLPPLDQINFPQTELLSSNNRTSTPIAKSNSDADASKLIDEPSVVAKQNKLQQILHQQKELLKSDIAKKRALQEQELQTDIQGQIEAAKSIQTIKAVEPSPLPELSDSAKIDSQERIASPPQSPVASNTVFNANPDKSHLSPANSQQNISNSVQNSDIDVEDCSKKRKRTTSEDSPFSPTESDGPSRKKRKSISSSTTSKKDKVYCICRKKYDSTKFYVGCDVCNEWVS